MTIDPNLSLQISSKDSQHRLQVVEEIEGLIKVYKDGHVERPDIVPSVGCSLAPELGVTCRDTIIDTYSNVWARIYVPTANVANKLPLLVYFHGGGFCVGAASWSCYHDFLAKLAAKASCAVVSVNYRLAPEHPLPAAYEDGVKAAVWAKQQESVSSSRWWSSKCDFSRIFLGGDSAGANIAYNVGLRVNSVGIKGLILIQPFIGGETRTQSERCMVQPPRSALTLAASDAYWRLALPAGANRDHPWCNVAAAGAAEVRRAAVLVCVAEMDILTDRNLEWCGGLARDGVRVEHVVSKGVGHAFQILNNSHFAQTRVHDLLSHLKNFVTR